MTPQQKDRIEKILSLFSEGVVTPEEVVSVAETLTTLVKQTKDVLDKKIETGDKETVAKIHSLKSDIDRSLARLQSATDSLARDKVTQKDIDDTSLMLQAEISRVASLIPSVPDEFDATGIYADLKDHKAILDNLVFLVVPENVRNGLEALPDGEKLAIDAIQGLRKMLEEIDRRSGGKVVSGGMTKALVLQLIAENAGSGGGHTIQDEGTPLTQRTNLNFVGAGVTVTDDAGNDATVVTISGAGSGAVDSVNGETGVVVLTTDDISDTAQTNKWATAAEKTKLGHISVTQAVDLDAIEAASHAAVTVTDSSEINFTLTGQDITASIVAGSIDESKLDTSVNASLDLADSASQPGHTHTASNITDFTEAAQDATGAMVGTSIVYNDAGPTLQRAALTGAITASQDSNTTALGSFTKAQLDAAVSDGNVLYVGDVTQYTDELAQDAVGGMVDTTLVYNDATPSLSRAALTGAVTASAGSNTTALGSFTKSQLSTAVSDGDVLFVGDVTSNATHTGEVTGSTALTVDKTAITNKTLVTAAVGDQVLIADASDTDNLKRVTVQTIVDLASGGGNTYFNNEYIDQSGGTSDTYGVLAGSINGSNTVFTVSQGVYQSGTLTVYLNGKLVLQGTGGGWTETTPASGTFTFVDAPQTGDEITAIYQTQTLSSETVLVRADVDDTPVNGATDVPVSSNWAFDHAATTANDTVVGHVELATTAETNTGTDATRAVTPDGLAGSYAGTKSLSIQVFDGTTNVATGDGKAYLTIPESLNGMNLVRAQATVVTAGTTNATTVMIHNKTDAQDMLSGAISIASGGTVGTVGTINGSFDDVATNDVLRIDVDSVSTTPPQGLMVVLEFRLP